MNIPSHLLLVHIATRTQNLDPQPFRVKRRAERGAALRPGVGGQQNLPLAARRGCPLTATSSPAPRGFWHKQRTGPNARSSGGPGLAHGLERLLLGRHAEQLKRGDGEGVRLQLVGHTKPRCLGPLRAVDVVAGEVYSPLLDAEPRAGVRLLDRVAEELRLLHSHRVRAAELILEGDTRPNACSVGLVAPIVVEPFGDFEATDQLL